MCGRFLLKSDPDRYTKEFSIHGEVPNWMPRYNFTPTSRGLYIVMEDGKRHLKLGNWSLIPHWSKDPKLAYKTFNAKCETVRTAPAFRSAYKTRRCLIPCDGFYEWSGPKSDRRPHLIERQDGHLLAFAGLWEKWESEATKEKVMSFTIITAPANDFMAKIHNRMPVILEAGDFDRWMLGDPDEVEALMKPAPEGLLKQRFVNKKLNSPGNEGPELLVA